VSIRGRLPCTARPVGCGVGVIATISDPASHLLSTAFSIYPITRLLSPVSADSDLGRKLPADSFAIYARVLEAIYTQSPPARKSQRWMKYSGYKRVFDLVKDFGTSESPKSTRSSTVIMAPVALRPLPCATSLWFAAQDNSRKWLDAAFGYSLCFPSGAQAHAG